jgi:hypothetical protein
MGEYAIYQGEEIEIGRTEDLCYLRAEQWPLVTPLMGDCDPAKYLADSLFRFPWPDEDDVEPGAFRVWDRALPVRGVKAPASLEDKHRRMQFRAHGGYLCSLPCPEAVELDGARYSHNGYQGAVTLCHQRWWNGMLVGVLRCNGCQIAWRLETIADAEEVAVALRSHADSLEGQDRRRDFAHAAADRLLAGYTLEMPQAVQA